MEELLMNKNTSGTVYGYIRVSTVSQRDDRQWIALADFGIPKKCIFVDKQSGKDFDRPAYTKMMKRLSHGDTLIACCRHSPILTVEDEL